MQEPTFKPCQCEDLCPREETRVVDGWTISWDGPMMSPPEYWSPMAERDGEQWFPEGEPGDPITEETRWLLC